MQNNTYYSARSRWTKQQHIIHDKLATINEYVRMDFSMFSSEQSVLKMHKNMVWADILLPIYCDR